MILKKVISDLSNFSLTGLANRNILGISDDSRKVGKDFLFCAAKGLHSDGHDFINEAYKKGATTFVVEKDISNLPKNVCVIKVKDTREALGEIASNFYGNPSKKLKVIGVTGTKGKTTTAHFIYQLLTRLGKKAGLVSSISAKVGKKDFDTGFHVTNPDTISLHSLLQKMLKAGCEYAVVEVSSHGIHQKRIAGVSFNISVITNIAPEHLDYHKTFEAYRDVKLAFLKKAPMVVLNADDPNFNYLTKKISSNLRKVAYSLHKDVDFNIASAPLSKNLKGDFNISNCLAAVSVVSLCGFVVKKINLVIPSLKLPEGRLEEIKNKNGFKIIIDFAHTPDSLENALAYLKADCRGKLIAVFGCAGERDPFKRPKMGKIASEIADLVVLTAEDPRSEKVFDIISQIESGVAKSNVQKIIKIADRSEAIKVALSKAKKGDTIGFLGKGHEKSMNLDGKTEIPWSDQVEIKKFLNIANSNMPNGDFNLNSTGAVVLSAGKGTRMKSETQKTIHTLLGVPMVSYILRTLKDIKIGKLVIVVGHKKEHVISAIGPEYSYATQKEQKGNAHAVLQAAKFSKTKFKHIFVFQGDDSFLYTAKLINSIYENHIKTNSTISVLSCDDNPSFPDTFWFVNYKSEKISDVFEGRNTKYGEPKMLISTYLFDANWLWKSLKKLRPSKKSGEYILPDLVKIAIKEKRKITGIQVEYKKEWFGVNNQEELKEAEMLSKKNIL